MAQIPPKLVECAVCLERYDGSVRQPKLLPCAHTLCLSCAGRLFQGGMIRCPECRRAHAIQGGATHLPPNPTVVGLLEQLKAPGMASGSSASPQSQPMQKKPGGYLRGFKPGEKAGPGPIRAKRN